MTDDGLLTDDGRLVASRCPACALVAFPAERYGCERCGALADSLLPVCLVPTGTVSASVLVHRHHDPALPPPFVVVAVALDGGPAIKGVLAGSIEPPPIGTRVRGFVADGRFFFEVD